MKLNKWTDPRFWDHPTPLNLMMIIVGVFSILYVGIWVFWLFTKLPWPPF